MSAALRISLLLLLIGILSFAFFRLARDDSDRRLRRADPDLLQDSKAEPLEFRRHQGESEVLENEREEKDENPAAGVLRVNGTISIEVAKAPEEKIKGGQIEIRILGPEGRLLEQLVEFQDGAFHLDLTTDDYALFVDAVVVDGLRGNIVMKEPWFERQEIETEGLHLEVKLGQLLRVEALDAATGGALKEAAVYRSNPLFVRDLSSSKQEPKPIAEGASPLRWRDSPQSGWTFFVGAPGFVAVALRQNEKSVKLEKAGHLSLSLDAPWAAIAANKHVVELKIEKERSGSFSWKGNTIRKTLSRDDQRRLLVENLEPGKFTVAIEIGDVGVLSQRFVEVRANETTRLEFKTELRRLAKPAHDVTILLFGPPVAVSWATGAATLTAFQEGRSLCDEPCNQAIGPFEEKPEVSEAVTTIRFGKKLPGEYEFQVLNERIRVYVPDKDLGPISLQLPQRPDLELRLLDEEGKSRNGQGLRLRGQGFGNFEYSSQRDCFLVPALCDEVQVFRLLGEPAREIWHSNISMDIFKGGAKAEHVIQSWYRLDVEIESDQPSVHDEGRTESWVDWSSFEVVIRDEEGWPVRVQGREDLGQSIRVWVDRPGVFRVGIDDFSVVPNKATPRQTVQLGPGLKPRLKFRLPESD